MKDSENQTGKCRKCGVSLSKEATESGNDLYCAGCRIALAEEQIAANMQKAAAQQKRKWLWPVLKFAILVIALGVIAFQFPRLITAFETPKPLRQGSYATDAEADRCIDNLWLISKGLGEGQNAPEKGMICPVSSQPYHVEVVDGNRVVSCPDPKRHGLSLMQISRKNPVPETRP